MNKLPKTRKIKKKRMGGASMLDQTLSFIASVFTTKPPPTVEWYNRPDFLEADRQFDIPLNMPDHEFEEYIIASCIRNTGSLLQGTQREEYLEDITAVFANKKHPRYSYFKDEILIFHKFYGLPPYGSTRRIITNNYR